MGALGAPDGNGPGGVFVMDHESFEPLGRWEVERGPQYFAYDFWWHLGHDTMITSEWGTPNMVEGGLDPEILMRSGYGHRLHVWDLRRRRHLQALDLGEEYQMALELSEAMQKMEHQAHEHWGHSLHLFLTNESAFAGMAAVALMVYDRLGLTILKRTWLNMDLIWTGALVGAGVITLAI